MQNRKSAVRVSLFLIGSLTLALLLLLQEGVFLALLLVGSVVLITLIILLERHIIAHWQEQARYKQHLALSMSPDFQRKIEQDRAYELRMARFALEKHLALLGAMDGSNVELTATGVEVTRFVSGRMIVNEAPPVALPAPQVKQPTQRFLISQLEPNALQVAPGVKADTGSPVILGIEDSVHFKLIGSSGFGKSCEAAAILDQATQTNSPDLLRIALLDLEHKTSRLFEDSPNVAVLRVGQRHVPMVATTADEVAEYLGYLKAEQDRRARLSEMDLQREPIMLLYVEEMLSLQYEVDEKLLSRMLANLAVLAVRSRKYRMFLLACAQTDYSTPELRTAQKQFRTRMAYAVDVTAARAAGFMSTELIKTNFTTSQKGDGQFVLESPGIAALMLAPVFDVQQKLLARERSTSVHERFTPPALQIVNSYRTGQEQDVNTETNSDEQAYQAKADEIQRLRALNWGKIAIIEKVWNVKRGGSQRWQQAVAEYEQLEA